MSTLTLVDAYDDSLEFCVSGNILIVDNPDDQVNGWNFSRDSARTLRDLLSQWLGDPEPSRIRASEVSFNEGILRLAAVHEQRVSFRYAKGDGAHIEQRTLVPETLFKANDGSLLVAGQDPDRNEYRAYRVDRIKGEVSAA